MQLEQQSAVIREDLKFVLDFRFTLLMTKWSCKLRNLCSSWSTVIQDKIHLIRMSTPYAVHSNQICTLNSLKSNFQQFMTLDFLEWGRVGGGATKNWKVTFCKLSSWTSYFKSKFGLLVFMIANLMYPVLNIFQIRMYECQYGPSKYIEIQ